MPSAAHNQRTLPDLTGRGQMRLLRIVNVVAFLYFIWVYPIYLLRLPLMLLMPVSFVGASFLPASHVAARYAIWLVAAYNMIVGVSLLVMAMWSLVAPGELGIGIIWGMLMLPAAVVGPLNAVALVGRMRRRRKVLRPESDAARLVAGVGENKIKPTPAISPQGFFSGIRFGPVVLGVVVDWALTILTMIALTAIFIDPAVWQVEEELFDAAYDTAFGAMFLDTGFLVTSFLLATLAIVAGAYVGARRAATLQLKYGLVIAVTSGLTGLLVYLLLGNGTGVQTPAWYDVTGWMVLIPAGVLGGYLAKRRDSSTSA